AVLDRCRRADADLAAADSPAGDLVADARRSSGPCGGLRDFGPANSHDAAVFVAVRFTPDLADAAAADGHALRDTAAARLSRNLARQRIVDRDAVRHPARRAAGLKRGSRKLAVVSIFEYEPGCRHGFLCQCQPYGNLAGCHPPIPSCSGWVCASEECAILLRSVGGLRRDC